MTKSVHNDVLDASLQYIIDNCDKITYCSAAPTTFTEGNATYALADVAVDSGDFSIADGDTSGRKLTVAAQSGVEVDTSGTYNHVALLDTANSKLLYVTEGTSRAIVDGDTLDAPAFDIEIRDPT